MNKRIPLYILVIIILAPLCWLYPIAYYNTKNLIDSEWEYIDSINKESSRIEIITEVIDTMSEAEITATQEYFKLETIEQIKDYIIKIAEQYRVNPELALKIAECESKFRNICNEKYGCSSGIGIYQILQSTFDEAAKRIDKEHFYAVAYIGGAQERIYIYDDPYDIKQNIDVAIWLMSKGEYERWDMSAWCWEATYFRVDL